VIARADAKFEAAKQMKKRREAFRGPDKEKEHDGPSLKAFIEGT